MSYRRIASTYRHLEHILAGRVIGRIGDRGKFGVGSIWVHNEVLSPDLLLSPRPVVALHTLILRELQLELFL